MRSASRLGITVAIVVVIAFALGRTDYPWDFGKIWEYRGQFLAGLGVTLGCTAVAYVIGLAGGVLVASARMSRNFVVRHLGDLYVEVIRGTPFIAQLFIAYFGIATIFEINNKWAVGTVALGVFAAAYIGEIIRAGVESIDRGQVEAGRSLGLSRARTMLHIVFPQAFKRMIPPLTGEVIALTKESSLLFAIGVVELMAAGRQAGADTYKTFEAYLVVAGFYLLITIPLSLLARRLERVLGTTQRAGAHL
ncbi:MAG: amino acid ABC transporter permease [Planctomycetota bacterium]|jgi:polar amino acid transport system permease protein